MVILEVGGVLGVKKMNESDSKKAVEQGWSDHGPTPAPRFRLQLRVEVRSKTVCMELGRSRKGSEGMGGAISTPSSCLPCGHCQSGAVGISNGT